MPSRKMTAKLTCCCLALVLPSLGAAAQQASDTSQRSRSDLDAIRKVGALLDVDVMNKANETIAGMEDLVLSPEGEVLYAVLSQGGIAGVGAKSLAVPWDVLDVKFVDGKWAVNLDLAREALGKAPTFQSDNYGDLTNPEWVARVREFFRPRANPQGKAERDPQSGRPRVVPTVLRATKIDGAKLKNARGEDVGAVEELLLDRDDRVAYAVVGRGGVLGIGESFVPVPWSKLRLTYNREDTSVTAVIDATRQQLEQAPLIKGDTYSTLLAPGFAGQIDRYFGVTRTGQGSRGDGGQPSGNDRP